MNKHTPCLSKNRQTGNHIQSRCVHSHHKNSPQPTARYKYRAVRQLITFYQHVKQTLQLMVGMPDYAAYIQHMQKKHPGCAVMSYEAFFRERQEARYGGKKRIGCC